MFIISEKKSIENTIITTVKYIIDTIRTTPSSLTVFSDNASLRMTNMLSKALVVVIET